MDFKQDFFISHASADKDDFIQPLAESLSIRGVTYWLDSMNMSWGDNLAIKINEGLRESRYAVICLSPAYISRQWTELELGAAIATRTGGNSGKVLPLILKDKDYVLQQYPIISSVLYKEYDTPEKIADSMLELAGKVNVPQDHIRISIESAHSGKLSNIVASRKASVGWLAAQARLGAGLKDELDTGGFQKFSIRWVLVDIRAEDNWKQMDQHSRSQVRALVQTNYGVHRVTSDSAGLGESFIKDGIVFHLYAVQDDHRGQEGGRGGDVVYYAG